MTAGRPRKHDEKIEEVLLLLGKGWAIRKVAQAMDVSKSAVGRIKKGWRLVDD